MSSELSGLELVILQTRGLKQPGKSPKIGLGAPKIYMDVCFPRRVTKSDGTLRTTHRIWSRTNMKKFDKNIEWKHTCTIPPLGQLDNTTDVKIHILVKPKIGNLFELGHIAIPSSVWTSGGIHDATWIPLIMGKGELCYEIVAADHVKTSWNVKHFNEKTAADGVTNLMSELGVSPVPLKSPHERASINGPSSPARKMWSPRSPVGFGRSQPEFNKGSPTGSTRLVGGVMINNSEPHNFTSSTPGVGSTTTYSPLPSVSVFQPSLEPELPVELKESEADIKRTKVKALWDFEGENDNELSFVANDMIWAIQCESTEEWWEGFIGETLGFFPAAYVQIVEE